MFSFNEYKEKRLEGENPQCLPLLFGISALQHTSNNFSVIQIEEDAYSIYNYIVENGKIQIVGFAENHPHKLKSIISQIGITEDTLGWWKCVFFRKNGEIQYDSYYDTLRVSENSDVTFGELMEDIKTEISSWTISLPVGQSFITGYYSRYLPLVYLCHSELGASTFPVELAEDYLDENRYIIYNNTMLDHVGVNVNNGLTLRTFVENPIRIMMPLTPELMNSASYMTQTWNEIVPDGEYEDYSVNGYKFKYIDLKVDCDVFNGVYITCSDLRGNKIVKEITE